MSMRHHQVANIYKFKLSGLASSKDKLTQCFPVRATRSWKKLPNIAARRRPCAGGR
jgi:hypothetical protein